jgi:glycosyltransferase involved in cell wall biosynthesis
LKVVVSLVGRFHAFDLAEQLEKRGYLDKLVTTYPKMLIKRWKISKKNIVSSPILEVANRLKHKIPFVSDQAASLLIKRIHAFQVSRLLKDTDILVAWSGSSLQAIIKAKKMGIPVILERGSTHHSFQMHILVEESAICGFEFTPDYYIWERDLLEYELADYISVPTNFVKNTFLQYGVPESKLLVNAYGVDLSSFYQVKKDDDIFRVIFCGQVSFQKGVHYLLQAFTELGIEGAELWLIGGMDPTMESYIRGFLSDSIIYKGSFPQSELYKLYSQGSVFCMPSIQEGMAMVQLQAMACGLPLICSEATGGGDILSVNGEEGFVVPIRSVSGLKEKILHLHDNPNLCKSMGEKAKKRVSSGFTWDDYGDRTILNYQHIVSKIN